MNRRPGIFRGIAVAALLALCASIMITALSLEWGTESAIYVAAPILGPGYVLQLLHGRKAKTGRVLAIGSWSVFALITIWLTPTMPTYLLLHVGAIWLVRSVLAYSSLLPAVADALLTTFSALTLSWAFARTGSVFLSTWCFFLVQSLWAFIPARYFYSSGKADISGNEQKFDQARRQADAALRQLFNH